MIKIGTIFGPAGQDSGRNENPLLRLGFTPESRPSSPANRSESVGYGDGEASDGLCPYNHKYKRHGQLFQNRYKSILCQEDSYLLELVRYIHLNPLRAKVVLDYKALGRYTYSGHSVLLGNRKNSW